VSRHDGAEKLETATKKELFWKQDFLAFLNWGLTRVRVLGIGGELSTWVDRVVKMGLTSWEGGGPAITWREGAG